MRKPLHPTQKNSPETKTKTIQTCVNCEKCRCCFLTAERFSGPCAQETTNRGISIRLCCFTSSFSQTRSSPTKSYHFWVFCAQNIFPGTNAKSIIECYQLSSHHTLIVKCVAVRRHIVYSRVEFVNWIQLIERKN